MSQHTKHPKVIWSLILSQCCNTFSYFGTLTILTLYLIHNFNLSRDDSYVIYSAYAVLIYTAPIIGGIIVDRFLGGYNTFIFGTLLDISGNLLLMSFNRYLFCLGLATSVMGAGLFKSSALYLVGSFYKEGEAQKEKGFTLTYLGLNIGGMAGPFIFGLIAYHVGWHFGFLFNACLLIFALGIFMVSWFKHAGNIILPTLSLSRCFFTYITVLVTCSLLSIPFYRPALFHSLILMMVILSVLYLGTVIWQYRGKIRTRLIGLSLICFFGIFYFSAGMQIGSTITLFIQKKIEQGIIHLNLPASVFSSLYCLFVIILAPISTTFWTSLKARHCHISVAAKVSTGILLAAFGMLSFALAAITHYVLLLVLMGILFLSAGELIIVPTVYTAVSDYAPEGAKAALLGGWLLCIAIGSYLSSILAKAADQLAALDPLHLNFNQFLFSAVFTLVVAVGMFACKSKITAMLASSA